jgi:hypothetical protein
MEKARPTAGALAWKAPLPLLVVTDDAGLLAVEPEGAIVGCDTVDMPDLLAGGTTPVGLDVPEGELAGAGEEAVGAMVDAPAVVLAVPGAAAPGPLTMTGIPWTSCVTCTAYKSGLIYLPNAEPHTVVTTPVTASTQNAVRPAIWHSAVA